VATLPTVRGAAVARIVPLGGGGWDTRVFPEEIVPTPDDDGIRSDRNAVSPDYFDVMAMPIVRGRSFAASDDERSAPVAIVNQTLAEQLWPNSEPLGQRFRTGRYPGAPIVEVVGVVETAKYRSVLEAPRAFFYQPAAQAYMPPMTLHVRTSSAPSLVVPAIERIVAELDGTIPIYGVGTLDSRLARSLGPQRTSATLVGVYGALALALAAVGLYGSMAYAVSCRTRELGIRMALGAASGDVMRRVLGEAARIALVGVIVGLAAAVPASLLLRNQLFGVRPGDPATFVAVGVVLIAVAVGAAFAPARRATRIDPVKALRAE
jgi:predicted permease